MESPRLSVRISPTLLECLESFSGRSPFESDKKADRLKGEVVNLVLVETDCDDF